VAAASDSSRRARSPSRLAASNGQATPPRDDAAAVDPLAGDRRDALLPELAQPDPPPCHLRFGLHQPEQVAGGRIVVHTEQQVGRREVEEAEHVRLDDLPEVGDAALQHGRRRDEHGVDRLGRLRRRQQVAHRADAARPGRQPGHLGQRPATAELLEPAELGDVDAGVVDGAVVTEVQRDLRVPLDPRDRVDGVDVVHLSSFRGRRPRPDPRSAAATPVVLRQPKRRSSWPRQSIAGTPSPAASESRTANTARWMRSAEGGQPGR
jgi:hypothetical protein